MLIITDVELFEGIIGGIGWLLAIYYLKNGFYKHRLNGKNVALLGIVSWCFIWYFRKIGMNFYLEYKKNKNESIKKIEIADTGNKQHFIFVFISIFTIIFYLLIYQFCSKSTIKLMKIGNLELPFILFFLFFIGLFIYSK